MPPRNILFDLLCVAHSASDIITRATRIQISETCRTTVILPQKRAPQTNSDFSVNSAKSEGDGPKEYTRDGDVSKPPEIQNIVSVTPVSTIPNKETPPTSQKPEAIFIEPAQVSRSLPRAPPNPTAFDYQDAADKTTPLTEAIRPPETPTITESRDSTETFDDIPEV